MLISSYLTFSSYVFKFNIFYEKIIVFVCEYPYQELYCSKSLW